MLKYALHKVRIKVGLLLLPAIKVAFSLLPKSMNLIILNGLTDALGITAIACDGKNGEFFGSSNDRHAIGQYVLTGSYSPELLAFISEFFRRSGGGTYVDVGANIGLLSIPLAKEGIHCVCFEPDPRNHHLFCLNAEAAGVKERIQMHNIALYDRRSQLDFEISPTNSGDNRVRVGDSNEKALYGEENRPVISVQTDLLDSILNTDTIQCPVLVKIDTQGAEVPIFKGGKEFLSQASVIVFEYSPYLARRQNNDERFLIEFIQEHFSQACVVEAGTGEQIRFGPISKAVSRMRELSDSYPHLRYADVFVRNA